MQNACKVFLFILHILFYIFWQTITSVKCLIDTLFVLGVYRDSLTGNLISYSLLKVEARPPFSAHNSLLILRPLIEAQTAGK